MTNLVLAMSIFVQAVAAALAIRLNWLYGRHRAWSLISVAFVLMTIRISATLVHRIDGQKAQILWLDEFDLILISAALTLIVSIFLLCGVASISPIFRHMKQVELMLAGKAERLQEVVSVNEAEFRIARRVQQQLYPSEDPRVDGLDISAGSIPASAASGDYFDYLPSHDGALSIVIGDASGHGMGAALLSTETRAYLHAASQSHDGPAELLAMANRFLCGDTTGGQFVTLLIVRIDKLRRAFVSSGAGHPAFLLHKSGVVETWNNGGLPLGIDQSASYTSSPACPLVVGDILLLCSDGLWEAQAADGSQFGLDRTFQIVNDHREQTSREITTLLFQAVESFTGRSIPVDDITIVVVKA